MLIIVKKMLQTFYFNNATVQNYFLKTRLCKNILKIDHESTKSRHKVNELKLRLSLLENIRPIKIAFLVTENSKWNVQSVYDAFDRSKYIEPLIITFPSNYRHLNPRRLVESEQVNFKFFTERNMKVISGFTMEKGYLDLKKIRPDIVFYEQPHQSLPDKLWILEVNMYALTCYVPYGFIQAKIQQLQFNRVFHHKMWRNFCETAMHKELFAKYSNIGDSNVVCTGYPKLDVYLDEVSQNEDDIWKVSKKENPRIKRIIWAPHHSIKNREVAFSTFHKYYLFFLHLAKNTPDLDWILKPHPWLREYCVKYKLMDKYQVDKYFMEWEELLNAQVYEAGDYFDIFRTSDVLILDCISFIAEYLPTGNPMLFLVNKKPHVLGFNEFGEKLTSGMYHADSKADIECFIQNVVLKNEDPLKEERIELVKNVLNIPPEGAGQEICCHIERQFMSELANIHDLSPWKSG